MLLSANTLRSVTKMEYSDFAQVLQAMGEQAENYTARNC
jgi:hypothetical protein